MNLRLRGQNLAGKEGCYFLCAAVDDRQPFAKLRLNYKITSTISRGFGVLGFWGFGDFIFDTVFRCLDSCS